MEGCGAFGKRFDGIVLAAFGEAEPVVLATPTGRQMSESGKQATTFFGGESGDEVGPLGEHVQQVEDG